MRGRERGTFGEETLFVKDGDGVDEENRDLKDLAYRQHLW